MVNILIYLLNAGMYIFQYNLQLYLFFFFLLIWTQKYVCSTALTGTYNEICALAQIHILTSWHIPWTIV